MLQVKHTPDIASSGARSVYHWAVTARVTSKAVVGVIGCLCLVVVVLYLLRSSGGDGSAPKAPAAAARRAGLAEREGPKTAVDASRGDRANTTDYRLERTGSGVAVAVDEATTPSFLTSWSDPKAKRTPRRALRGRVLC
mgnify:CR=1 FL=1